MRPNLPEIRIARHLARSLRRLASARDGAMGIMGALAVVVLIAVSVLALEASTLYVAKGDMQRVADLANLAAANTSGAITDGAASATAIATAQQLAMINGYSANMLTTSVTNSPTQGQLLTTSVTDPVTMSFGQLLLSQSSVDVVAKSSASVGAGAISGDCLRTLSGGLSIFSSASVSGSGCTIASATYFYYCSNAASSASAVEVGYSAALESIRICSNADLTPPLSAFTFDKTSTDPLASDSRTAAMKRRLQAMSSWPHTSTFQTPLTPAAVSGGADQTYTNNSSATATGSKYHNISLSDSTVTFTGNGAADPTCTNPVTITGNLNLSGTSTIVLGSGCYAIRGVVSIANGAVASIQPASGASVTLALQQYLFNGNGTITFGDMLFSAVGIINNGNGGTINFGNGPFYLGFGVYNTSGTVTFGNGPFYFKNGSINNNGTGTITFGDGPFYFYYCSLLNANGVVTLGAGDFEFFSTSLSTFNSSKTTFGKGNMDLYLTPVYIDGAEFTIGGSGDATAGSSSMFFYWSGLQIAAGKFTASGTSLGFWYGNFILSGNTTAVITAPTSESPSYGYQNVLAALYSGNFSIYQNNVSDTFSGTVYNPGNDVSFFGQQTSDIATGGCFAVISSTISIYSSSTAALKPCWSGSVNTRAAMAN